MNKFTEIIDKYLSGQMSTEEKTEFETQLKLNPELNAEFELQKQVMKGVQRHGLKESTQQGLKKGSFKTKMFKWGTAILITAATSVLIWVAKEKMFSHKENVRYELNEENKKQWTDADKNLSSEVFEINAKKDTVIETQGGIVIAIPAGAFLNKAGVEVKGNIEIEIKEALNPSDIMKAGLSTMSDGKLLQTGGMFYINARQDDENLALAKNKGLYVNVPAAQQNKDMMLFEGKRLDNGQINWVNPKPFENKLNAVDILSLNFYPPHFLDSVKAFGFDVTNKRLTDSIYYSLECGYESVTRKKSVAAIDSSSAPMVTTAVLSIEDEKLIASIQQAVQDSENVQMKRSLIEKLRPSANGATVFKQNCAVCHFLDNRKLTGPGLQDADKRAPKGDWLFNYIKNCEKVKKSGDVYANSLSKGNSVMTVFEGTLSDAEIRSLVSYIWGVSVESEATSACEISPSRIHAIWDIKFNNTILATKEFEERLQAIFGTCNSGVFNLYAGNLNKKLYELDSMAMSMTQSHKFEEFYERRDGGVPVNESHMQMLGRYLEEKRKTYLEAAKLAMQKLYDDERRKSEMANEKRVKHGEGEGMRETKKFSEEFRLNLKEAYRQLGKPEPKIVTNIYYSVTIVNMGWKNVDAYVAEATIARTTLNYTDPETGNKAVIKYTPFTLTISEYANYERVFAYLLPNKLSSFQRMNNAGNVFKENLNELINYDLVVLGFKGKDVYFKQIADVKSGEKTVTLEISSQVNVDALLKNYTYSQTETDFTRELKYQVFEQQEEIRQTAIKNREEITWKLKQTIYPCMYMSSK